MRNHRRSEAIFRMAASLCVLAALGGCLVEETAEETEPGQQFMTDSPCPYATACIQFPPSANQACIPSFAPHGALCDDGNPDTHGDVCNGQGGCVGSPITCPAPAQCTSSYQVIGGQCTPKYALAGAVCDDGNPATVGDLCDGFGQCQGKTVDCPTPSQCTPSYQVSGGLCVPQHLAAGTPCSDGMDETMNDTCNGAGLCGGTTVNCPGPTQCIAGYTKGGGSCQAHYAPSGAACDDGNPNTFQDTCNGTGMCKGAPCTSANVIFSNTANAQVGHVKLTAPNQSQAVVLESAGGRVAWVKTTLSASCENLTVSLSAPSKYPNLCHDQSHQDPCAPVLQNGAFTWNCVSSIHWFHKGQKQTLPGYHECPLQTRTCAVIGGAGKELFVSGASGLQECTGQCGNFQGHPNRTCKWGTYNVKL